ncbi:MAG: hypothetical protein K0B02_01115 [DPANN group archaeon]|nr:hypothetical protein [DPANN group archaeon]
MTSLELVFVEIMQIVSVTLTIIVSVGFLGINNEKKRAEELSIENNTANRTFNGALIELQKAESSYNQTVQKAEKYAGKQELPTSGYEKLKRQDNIELNQQGIQYKNKTVDCYAKKAVQAGLDSLQSKQAIYQSELEQKEKAAENYLGDLDTIINNPKLKEEQLKSTHYGVEREIKITLNTLEKQKNDINAIKYKLEQVEKVPSLNNYIGDTTPTSQELKQSVDKSRFEMELGYMQKKQEQDLKLYETAKDRLETIHTMLNDKETERFNQKITRFNKKYGL